MSNHGFNIMLTTRKDWLRPGMQLVTDHRDVIVNPTQAREQRTSRQNGWIILAQNGPVVTIGDKVISRESWDGRAN